MSFEELPYFMTPKQLADVTGEHVGRFVGRGQHQRIQKVLHGNGFALFDAGI